MRGRTVLALRFIDKCAILNIGRYHAQGDGHMKRWITLLLALMLVIGMLAGCEEKRTSVDEEADEDDSDDEDEDAGEDEAGDSSDETGEDEPDEDAFDEPVVEEETRANIFADEAVSLSKNEDKAAEPVVVAETKETESVLASLGEAGIGKLLGIGGV